METSRLFLHFLGAIQQLRLFEEWPFSHGVILKKRWKVKTAARSVCIVIPLKHSSGWSYISPHNMLNVELLNTMLYIVNVCSEEYQFIPEERRPDERLCEYNIRNTVVTLSDSVICL